jgi:hypothetical protein
VYERSPRGRCTDQPFQRRAPRCPSHRTENYSAAFYCSLSPCIASRAACLKRSSAALLPGEAARAPTKHQYKGFTRTLQQLPQGSLLNQNGRQLHTDCILQTLVTSRVLCFPLRRQEIGPFWWHVTTHSQQIGMTSGIRLTRLPLQERSPSAAPMRRVPAESNSPASIPSKQDLHAATTHTPLAL